MTVSHTLHCSFCGKSQNKVQKLIAGTTALVCNECVALCSDILSGASSLHLRCDADTLVLSRADFEIAHELGIIVSDAVEAKRPFDVDDDGKDERRPFVSSLRCIVDNYDDREWGTSLCDLFDSMKLTVEFIRSESKRRLQDDKNRANAILADITRRETALRRVRDRLEQINKDTGGREST